MAALNEAYEVLSNEGGLCVSIFSHVLLDLTAVQNCGNDTTTVMIPTIPLVAEAATHSHITAASLSSSSSRLEDLASLEGSHSRVDKVVEGNSNFILADRYHRACHVLHRRHCR